MIDRNELVAVIARAQDADYFLEEVDRWESQENWEREAHPDNYPDMAYEDLKDFQRVADAILAALDLRPEAQVKAEAWDEGYYRGSDLEMPQANVVNPYRTKQGD